MLHSVHGLNPMHLDRVASTLQRIQDAPEVLDRYRRRFDVDEPPPPYSPATITDPPSPISFLAQRSEHEKNELIRRPLDNEELYRFRTRFHGYHPGLRFEEESAKERDRIRAEHCKRDEDSRPIYSGPDLIGRPGMQRLKVMARNSIRKRWERLGIWNPIWGIPDRVTDGAYDNTYEWRWKWDKPRQDQIPLGLKLHAEEVAMWPHRYEEGADARAIRQFLDSKGHWGERYGPALALSNEESEADVDPRESLITTRPWFKWKLEVEEEARRLARVQRSSSWPDYETAKENAKTRWQAKGDWKDSWRDAPGWKWRQESPSPEPEDPNDMDFSPSEMDALDSIPPPTPLPSFSPIIIPPYEGPRIFFPDVETDQSVSVQRADDADCSAGSEVDTGARDNKLVGDTETNPSYSKPLATSTVEQPGKLFAVEQPQSQNQKIQLSHGSNTPPTTRRLRKRKRDRADEVSDNEPSLTEATSFAEVPQKKRPRIAPAIKQAPPLQAKVNLGSKSKTNRKTPAGGQSRCAPGQYIADSVGALHAPEPRPALRRSSRIRDRRGTS